MKTGIILYIVGDSPTMKGTDPSNEIAKLGLDADRVEIASRDYGHPDVHDAWWVLTSKGMHRILCAIAEMNPYGGLSLKGPMLRLCG